MLEAFGVTIDRAAGEVAVVGGARRCAATRVDVPGDFSSAAFFIVAGADRGHASRSRIRDVGVNPTRTALIDILRLMGADIRVWTRTEAAGEPRADIEVHPGRLRGIAVPPSAGAGRPGRNAGAVCRGGGRRRGDGRDAERLSCA